MARLIDENDVYSLFNENGTARLHVADIDTIPRVDAVPVVRCRECKHHEDTSVIGFEHCCLYGLTMRYNDFCSYGKREGGAE